MARKKVVDREIINQFSKPPRVEKGATGRSQSALYQYRLSTDEYLAALMHPNDIVIYNKMERSDAMVKAILLMLELPIRSTEWFVTPRDSSDNSKHIANFVQDSLLGVYPNGLITGFDEFIKNVCSMFQYGHSIFEKVWGTTIWNNTPGYFKLKKLAIRPQSTIYDFIYDRVGDISKIRQQLPDRGFEIIDINIKKLLIFSHDMKGGDIRGTSVLRSAYKHWYIKDFLYKILNVGIERNLVGTPVLTLPESYTQEDFDLAKEVTTELKSSELGGATLPNGFILDMFEGKRTLIDVLPYLEHQDQSIAKSILAQFMNLGGSNSGSFALSYDQSQMFLMMLEASAKNIANIINTHVIPELVGYNFDSDLYPRIEFKTLNSGRLINVLKTLVDGRLVVPDKDLEKWVRDMLNLPDYNRQNSQQDPQQDPDQDTDQDPQQDPDHQENNIKKDMNRTLDIGSSASNKNTMNNQLYDSHNKSNETNGYQTTTKVKNNDFNSNNSSIKFSEKDKNNIRKVIEKQYNDLMQKIKLTESTKWSLIKLRYKKELSDILYSFLDNQKSSVKLDELYIKASIKASRLSETMKYEVLLSKMDNKELKLEDLFKKLGI